MVPGTIMHVDRYETIITTMGGKYWKVIFFVGTLQGLLLLS